MIKIIEYRKVWDYYYHLAGNTATGNLWVSGFEQYNHNQSCATYRFPVIKLVITSHGYLFLTKFSEEQTKFRTQIYYQNSPSSLNARPRFCFCSSVKSFHCGELKPSKIVRLYYSVLPFHGEIKMYIYYNFIILNWLVLYSGFWNRLHCFKKFYKVEHLSRDV